MWRCTQQAFAFVQRFTYQGNLAVLKVTQPAMNDSCRTAGGAGTEIILLYEQSAFAMACTLSRDGHAVDAAADHQDFKSPALQWKRATHNHHHEMLFTFSTTL